MFTEDGEMKSGKYVRDWLKLQLAQGKRVLPMSKDCEGFSYQDGCPGHPCPDDEVTAASSQNEQTCEEPSSSDSK